MAAMRNRRRTTKPSRKSRPRTARAEPKLRESWQVVVQCRDEDQQREIYERMTDEGFKCRVLVM
jgi:hypothetical protein